MSVKEFLESIGVVASDEILQALTEEEVDAKAIIGLTDEQLKELGFKMGARSKILQAAKQQGKQLQ